MSHDLKDYEPYILYDSSLVTSGQLSRKFLDLAMTALVKIISSSLFTIHPSSQHTL